MTSSAHLQHMLPHGLPAIPPASRGQRRDPPAGRRNGLAPWQIRRVTAFMRTHLDRPFSLAELAGLVGLSRFHFCTAFRLATRETPRNWLTNERIRRAAALLEEHKLSVTEIALEVGYDTPSAFTARFRERTGMTPSEYRRAC